ncbi:MAG: hypothetical protein ACC656_14975 [Candidatus Heimdallarchaeota archaeon]
MNKIKADSKITKGFNVVLFFYMFFVTMIEYLFEPETKDIAPWDAIYNISPVISIVVAIAFMLILVLGGAKLFQIFWNRFILDIFKIRHITFQEALAIILIAGIGFF